MTYSPSKWKAFPQAFEEKGLIWKNLKIMKILTRKIEKVCRKETKDRITTVEYPRHRTFR